MMLIVANRGIADNSKWKGFRSFSRCKLFMESPGFKLNRNEQGQYDGAFFLRGPTIQDYKLYYYTSFGYVEVHQREIGNIHEPKLT